MERHRLLLVGAGSRVREVLLPALASAALPHRVVGVVDPDPHAAEQLPTGPVPIFTDLEQALARGGVDTALLACPHDGHHEAALRLVEAGVVVWKEKPYALTLAQASELAHRGGSVRVLAHRPHSQLYSIATRLLSGWGRLLSYRIRITRPIGDYSTTWRAHRDRAGGGVLLDLGYHAFDLIARLTGSPATSVYALTSDSPAWRPRLEVEESAQALLTHRDGSTGAVYVSRCDERVDAIDLLAEGGRITITDTTARISVGEHADLTHTVTLQASENPWAAMLAHHARTRDDRSLDADDARIGTRATALVQAAYTSLHSARPEALPTTATRERIV